MAKQQKEDRLGMYLEKKIKIKDKKCLSEKTLKML